MTTTYNGFPACICQAEWLSRFEKLVAFKKLPPLRLAQLIGNAPASAGRHLGGGNIDWWSIDVDTARLARRFGGLAMLRDGTRDSFDDNKHTHCYLPGCPHMSDGARKDMAEVMAGGDGLVGSVPDDPRLAGIKVPSWQEGVRRMDAIFERLEKIQKAEKRIAKWTRWKRRAKSNIKKWSKKNA